MITAEDIIVQLVKQGLSVRAVSELFPDFTANNITRLATRHLGKVANQESRSVVYGIPITMRPIVDECLRRLGKDPNRCENCGAVSKKRCDIHHRKYEGATIYDLAYFCRPCNQARANKGLK